MAKWQKEEHNTKHKSETRDKIRFLSGQQHSHFPKKSSLRFGGE